jgi:hypothetical protein
VLGKNQPADPIMEQSGELEQCFGNASGLRKNLETEPVSSQIKVELSWPPAMPGNRILDRARLVLADYRQHAISVSRKCVRSWLPPTTF